MKPIQRRAFIRNVGAAVAATTAATTAAAASKRPHTDGITSLSDDETSIRQLHHTFVAHFNKRQHEDLRALFASEIQQQVLPGPVYILGDAQHLDTISIAPDQQRATARFHCRARLEAALSSSSSSSSLVEMARQQGQGVIQWWESGVLENEYVKVASLWKIAAVSFHSYNELRNATNSSFSTGGS